MHQCTGAASRGRRFHSHAPCANRTKIDLYIGTQLSMGLPLPPESPVRYAFFSPRLFRITLKEPPPSHQALSVRRACRSYCAVSPTDVWTNFAGTAPGRLYGCFPGRRKGSGCCNQVDGFASGPARPLSATCRRATLTAGGYRRLRRDVPWFKSVTGPRAPAQTPVRRRWCWTK